MAMIDFNELHALVLRAPAGSVVAVSFLDGVSLVLHAPSVGQRSDVEDPSVSFTRLSSILRTAAPGTAARIAFPDGLNLSVSTNSRGRLHQAPDEAPAPTLAPEAVDALNLAPPIVPLASQAAAPPAEAAPSTAPEKEVLVPNATPAQPKEPPPPPLISSTSNSPDQGKRVERRPRFGERPVVGTVRGLEAATNSTSLASGPGEVASSSSSSSSLPLGASEPSTPATPLRASHRHTSLSPTGRRSHRKLHQIPREERRAMLQAAKSAHESSSWNGRARSLSSDVASLETRQRRGNQQQRTAVTGNGMPTSAEPLHRGGQRHRSWAVADFQQQEEESDILDTSSDHVTPSRRKPRHLRARNSHRDSNRHSLSSDSTSFTVSSEAQREALSAVTRLAAAIDSRRLESQATLNSGSTTLRGMGPSPVDKAVPEHAERASDLGVRPQEELNEAQQQPLHGSYPPCHLQPSSSNASSIGPIHSTHQAPNPFEALAAAANQSAAPRPASPPSWPEPASEAGVQDGDDEASPDSVEIDRAAEESTFVVKGSTDTSPETPVWRRAAEYWARQLTSPDGESHDHDTSEAFNQPGEVPRQRSPTASAAAISSKESGEDRPSPSETQQLAMGGPPIVGARQRIRSTTAPAPAPTTAPAAASNTSSPPVPSGLAGFAVWAPSMNAQPKSPAKVLRVSPQPPNALRPTPERPAKRASRFYGDAAVASPPLQAMRNNGHNPFEKSSLDHSPLTSPFESPVPITKNSPHRMEPPIALDAAVAAARSPRRSMSSNDVVLAAAKKLEEEATVCAIRGEAATAASNKESAMGGPPVTSPSSHRASAQGQLHHEIFVVQFTRNVGGREACTENSHKMTSDQLSEHPVGASSSPQKWDSFQTAGEASLQQDHPESPQFTEEHMLAISRCIENLTPQEALRIHNNSVTNRDEDGIDYGSDEMFKQSAELSFKSNRTTNTEDAIQDQNEEWCARGPWYV